MLSAGQFMAGRPDCVIATVATGDPPPELTVTPFDRQCGFRTSRQAMQDRRSEDLMAARALAARHHHLGLRDSQYGCEMDALEITTLLRDQLAITGARMVVGPLGLAHPDHVVVASAVVALAAGDRTLDVWLYEDLPARVLWPETVVPALGAARVISVVPTLGFIGTGDLGVKMRALRCYRSQMAALTRSAAGCGLNPVLVPERFWQLV